MFAHLAAAAQMFVAAYQGPGSEVLQKLVADEQRAYGWSHLADDAGARAERAFDEFAAFVERHRATRPHEDQQL